MNKAKSQELSTNTLKFNELMRDLLAKINHDNKKSIIAGDFNLSLLKYTQIRGIHDFWSAFCVRMFYHKSHFQLK